MLTHSKAHQTFTNRVLQLDADLELIDIFDASIKAGLLPTAEERLFEKISHKKHPVLSRRKVTTTNQKLAMNHLRQTVFSSYIKDLYEEVYEYLRSILVEAAVNAKVDPKRFVGDHHVDINITDVLQADRIQIIIEDIVNKIFRKLENERSTTALITKTCGKLDIKVSEEKQRKAIYYLEIRHQLVHADGKADEEFKEKHPDIPYAAGDYIDLRFKLIKDTRKAVLNFVDEFDQKAIEKGLVSPPN